MSVQLADWCKEQRYSHEATMCAPPWLVKHTRVIWGHGQNTCIQPDPSQSSAQIRIVAARFMFGGDDKEVSLLFHMSHDGNQTVLGIERPKTGMFTFDKSTGENSYVVSRAVHTHTHPPGSIYGDLSLGLCRAAKGGNLRQISAEKQGCLSSHPQEECTPAWILHRPAPRGFKRLIYTSCSGIITKTKVYLWKPFITLQCLGVGSIRIKMHYYSGMWHFECWQAHACCQIKNDGSSFCITSLCA